MKVRLDKYLANLGLASRKEIGKLVRKGLIYVNGESVSKSDIKLTENDIIDFLGQEIPVIENMVVVLNKPAGYISSDVNEAGYKSYKHLIKDCFFAGKLKVAGRLDVDTEGLLVLSSDGKLIHKLISPKQGKKKIYYVEAEKELSTEDIEKLRNGIDIGDYITLPANILLLPEKEEEIIKFGDFKKSTLSQIPKKTLKGKQAFLLSIVEGKFHQIKRMLEALNNKVVYLKRLKLADYELEDLKLGEWKIVGR